jgi:4-hydroxy-3-polyprenylbenzoate decarboxylase
MRIVVGITGASGAQYAQRTIELLCKAGVDVHVAASDYGRRILAEELGMTRLDKATLSGGFEENLTVYPGSDLGAACASGSFLHDGMIVVPCSSNTLSKISLGMTDTLVQRAAAVTLKEGRRLVLAHRETPISRTELNSMIRASEAGAIIAPLSPGLYLGQTTIAEVVDSLVGRLLDLLGVEHDIPCRWEGELAKRGRGGLKSQKTGHSRPE